MFEPTDKALYEEFRELVYKACNAVDMQLGDNVHYLPNMIKKLVKERDQLKAKVQSLEKWEREHRVENKNWETDGGW